MAAQVPNSKSEQTPLQFLIEKWKKKAVDGVDVLRLDKIAVGDRLRIFSHQDKKLSDAAMGQPLQEMSLKIKGLQKHLDDENERIISENQRVSVQNRKKLKPLLSDENIGKIELEFAKLEASLIEGSSNPTWKAFWEGQQASMLKEAMEAEKVSNPESLSISKRAEIGKVISDAKADILSAYRFKAFSAKYNKDTENQLRMLSGSRRESQKANPGFIDEPSSAVFSQNKESIRKFYFTTEIQDLVTGGMKDIHQGKQSKKQIVEAIQQGSRYKNYIMFLADASEKKNLDKRIDESLEVAVRQREKVIADLEDKLGTRGIKNNLENNMQLKRLAEFNPAFSKQNNQLLIDFEALVQGVSDGGERVLAKDIEKFKVEYSKHNKLLMNTQIDEKLNTITNEIITNKLDDSGEENEDALVQLKIGFYKDLSQYRRSEDAVLDVRLDRAVDVALMQSYLNRKEKGDKATIEMQKIFNLTQKIYAAAKKDDNRPLTLGELKELKKQYEESYSAYEKTKTYFGFKLGTEGATWKRIRGMMGEFDDQRIAIERKNEKIQREQEKKPRLQTGRDDNKVDMRAAKELHIMNEGQGEGKNALKVPVLAGGSQKDFALVNKYNKFLEGEQSSDKDILKLPANPPTAAESSVSHEGAKLLFVSGHSPKVSLMELAGDKQKAEAEETRVKVDNKKVIQDNMNPPTAANTNTPKRK